MESATVTETKVIASFDRYAGEKIQLTRGYYKGNELFNLRKYKPNDSGELLPTRKGICFMVGDKDLPRILKAWQKELESMKN